MFCPKCSAYLTEKEMIKTNTKTAGGIMFEYDAQCPNCSVTMGRIVWGKLYPAPEFERDVEKNAFQKEEAPAPARQPEDGKTTPEPKAANPEPKRCPHCGKAL